MTAMIASAPLITLAELVRAVGGAGVKLEGDGSIAVNDVTQDSRVVRPGSLFVARRGGRVNGFVHARAAAESGAVAVLYDENAAAEDLQRIPEGLARLSASDLPLAWALSAHAVHGHPSLGLSVVGITGTNGKTTTAALVANALGILGKTSARLGTLGFFIGDREVSGTLTTPQPDDLARYLAEARSAGASHFVMEVSSHALEQHRVAGVKFEIAAFLNLTQDHLDFHGTMEAYGAAKARLFTELAPARTVVNLSDEFGRGLSEKATVTRSVALSSTPEADIEALSFEQGRFGLQARLRIGDRPYVLASRLVGKHNLENLLVALGILLELGFEPREALRALAAVPAAPGRLERCDTEADDILVVVDYAHTPAALVRACEASAELSEGRLTCVFGCGGDRDRGKRPLMAEAARQGADRVVVTSDNPRTEDPQRIIDDIVAAYADTPSGDVVVEVDRARAIELAVLGAAPGDVVLIAGKGHETYQLVGDQVLPFDDREQARAALEERRKKHRGGEV